MPKVRYNFSSVDEHGKTHRPGRIANIKEVSAKSITAGTYEVVDQDAGGQTDKTNEQQTTADTTSVESSKQPTTPVVPVTSIVEPDKSSVVEPSWLKRKIAKRENGA